MQVMLPLRGQDPQVENPCSSLYIFRPAHTGVEYWQRGVHMSKLHCIKLYLKQKAENDNGGREASAGI